MQMMRARRRDVLYKPSGMTGKYLCLSSVYKNQRTFTGLEI